MSHFEIYGLLAKEQIPDTHKNGRYLAQSGSERKIAADVIDKLKIQKGDSVLDVGCGVGVNIEPISQIAERVVGCDHQNVVNHARKKNSQKNVNFIAGDFLDIKFNEQFDKILVYGVLPTFPTYEVMWLFIDKCLSLLKLNGRLLFGDIPNVDKKSRFQNSQAGRKFQKDWEENSAKYNDDALSLFLNAGDTIQYDDKICMSILAHIRAKGFHAYLVDQPQDLPFGNSREDILVVGSEYSE